METALTNWQKISGATFEDEQAARLLLKNGEELTGFFRDCEWIREGDAEVTDCFQRDSPSNTNDEIELDEIEGWRDPTPAEMPEEL